MAVAATKKFFLAQACGGHRLSKPVSLILLTSEYGVSCRVVRKAGGCGGTSAMTISTSSALCLGVPQSQLHPSDIKMSRWNRAIAEADKFLGYPKMTTPIPMVPIADFAPMADHLGNIVEPNNPLIKIVERFIFCHNNMQARGLIILMLAKVIGHLEHKPKASKEEVFEKHSCLATGADLGHMSKIAHNATRNTKQDESDSATPNRLEYANKVSIMMGDIMLAKANLLFGIIMNAEVARIMTISLGDFVVGKFMYDQDEQGTAYPSNDITIADWETASFNINASMMAHTCDALMIVSELDQSYRTLGFEFGKHLGLALQASTDLEEFAHYDQDSSKTPFSLVSCPVVLHLQRDKSLLKLVVPHRKDLSKVDYKKVYEVVSAGPAIRETQEICQNHVQRALKLLRQFPNSEARAMLENILTSLLEV